MTKEHKKLYKAGKNWVVATLTATTITLLGGIAYTAHADTTIENTQSIQAEGSNQSSQNNNSNNSVVLTQPVTTQSNSTVKNSQPVQNTPTTLTVTAATNNSSELDPNIYGTVQSSQNNNSNNSVVLNQPVTTQSHTIVQSKQPVQGNQTAQDNQNTSATIAAVTDVNNDDGLDPNIYGTVNVKDWDYQENNNIFNLTGYHGAYNHIILPNLNDFNNAGVNVNGATGVGITSNVLHGILCDAKNPDADLNLAISRTTGIYNDKVIAENENWAGVFCPYNLTYENGKPVLRGTNQFTLVNADLSNLDTNKVTNIAYLFNNQNKLQTVSGLNNWNTSKVTDMSYVFGACWALNNVGDLSSWDTSNVTNMAGMFASSALSDLTMIKDWNTSKVQNLEGTFRKMDNLTALDLSRWDTSQVTNMSDMFDNLKHPIDLSKLNTSKVTDMSYMFFGAFFGAHVANNIKGFENWDTSNVRTMKAMFKDSEFENLLSISNWDTSKVEDMSSMFMGTQNLKQLDLTKWDCSSLTNVGTSYQDAMFEESNLSFYIVLNRSKNNPNEITLYDPYGLMGNKDTIIAEIKAPTFYQQVAGKSENDVIIETITPIVEAYAKNEYTNFYMHLNPGMKEIYPTSANIKLASYVEPSNPYSAVNCQFNYTTKIGELKDAVINYYDQDRNLIKTDYFKGVIGKTMQVPYTMPDGYMLLDGEQIPNSITFKEGKLQIIDVYLKEAPVTKQVVVNYVDVNGQTVKSNSLSGNIGETISLNLSLPEGYELVDGQSIPSSITLKENENQTITVKVTKAPAVKTGSINYVDQDGKVIKTDTISGKVGDKINVKLSLPDGYELANKDEQIPSTVTVTEDGISPISVNIKKINTTPTTPVNPTEPNNQTSTSNNEAASIPEKSTPNTFKNINGSTYYYDENGNLYRNQFYSNWGHTYYFGPDGARYTDQFLGKDGKVYYFDNQGIMYQDQYYKNWGHTYYFGADGARYTDQFLGKDGKVYYFDNQGIMYQDQYYKNWGHTYYFGADGARYTDQFLGKDGKVYYFDNQGIMYQDQYYKNWGHTYYFGADGARYTDQFLGKDGKVYYFNNQGIMYQDQYYKNWGHTYYFGADGARYTDQFLGKDGKVYYFDNQGIMYQDQYYKNWGHTYYFGADGARYTDQFLGKDGKVYYFNNQGIMYQDQYYKNWGHTYYFGADGARYTDQFLGKDGKVYYFDNQGIMYQDQYYKNWGHTYYFGPDGARYTDQFLGKDGKVYYFDNQGIMYQDQYYKNWGHTYYFGNDGALVTNQDVTINGVKYHADNQGILTPVQPAKSN